MTTTIGTGHDARTILAAVVRADRVVARAEADKLAAIAHFCDLHPVIDPDHVPATLATDPSLLGDTTRLPIAGEGCPTVRDTAVHELSAALGISNQAALLLVGQTLELRHRLPRIWALVQDLTLPAWQG